MLGHIRTSRVHLYHPRAVDAALLKEDARVPRTVVFLVGIVFGFGNISEVFDAVVGPIVISVIDVIDRPSLGVEQPDDTVDEV